MSVKYNFTSVRHPLQNALRNFCAHDFFLDRKLKISCLEDAVIACNPAAGICVGKEFRSESMVHSFWMSKRFQCIPEICEFLDEDVIFLGSMNACWGHCITDNLKHLWPFVTGAVYDIEKSCPRLRFAYVIDEGGRDIPRNFCAILETLGIQKERIIRVKTPTRFRRIFLPDASFFSEESTKRRYYTNEFRLTVDAIVAKAAPHEDESCYEKVYLTRSGWKKGNPDFGEDAVESVFKSKGYKVIRPEECSLSRMIALMKGCRSLATTEGSCAHNSIFMQEGSELIILRKADYVNEYQPVINQMRGLDVTYVDAHHSTCLTSKDAPFGGPFFLCVTRELSNYANVPRRFSLWLFARYCIFGWCLRMKVISRRAFGFVKRRVWR